VIDGSLHEYQGKQILKEARILVPTGEVTTTPQGAAKIAEEIGKPVVVKAQIWAGGRGKAGGIKFAANPAEAETVAGILLGSEIKKLKVEKVLVEEKLEIEREFYVGVIIDPSMKARCPVVMFSTEGGVDIESVHEGKIAHMNVDVLRGFHLYDALNYHQNAKRPHSRRLESHHGALSDFQELQLPDGRD
jgi:succinyl-CoA synthetase beta subunit